MQVRKVCMRSRGASDDRRLFPFSLLRWIRGCWLICSQGPIAPWHCAGRLREAFETARTYRGHFNVPNRGCITNLPHDAVVEVTRHGYYPTAPGTCGGYTAQTRRPAWSLMPPLRPESALIDGGVQATVPGDTRMAAACDDENLYLAYDCSGVDTSKIASKAQKRDSNDVSGSDNNLQILVDAAGAERVYLGFVVPPAAGQADYRAYYWPTSNHFRTDHAWDAEWTARTSHRPVLCVCFCGALFALSGLCQRQEHSPGPTASPPLMDHQH